MGKNLQEQVADLSSLAQLGVCAQLGSDGLLPRLIAFLATHHDNAENAHEGCEACVFINHIQLIILGD